MFQNSFIDAHVRHEGEQISSKKIIPYNKFLERKKQTVQTARRRRIERFWYEGERTTLQDETVMKEMLLKEESWLIQFFGLITLITLKLDLETCGKL